MHSNGMRDINDISANTKTNYLAFSMYHIYSNKWSVGVFKNNVLEKKNW